MGKRFKHSFSCGGRVLYLPELARQKTKCIIWNWQQPLEVEQKTMPGRSLWYWVGGLTEGKIIWFCPPGRIAGLISWLDNPAVQIGSDSEVHSTFTVNRLRLDIIMHMFFKACTFFFFFSFHFWECKKLIFVSHFSSQNCQTFNSRYSLNACMERYCM